MNFPGDPGNPHGRVLTPAGRSAAVRTWGLISVVKEGRVGEALTACLSADASLAARPCQMAWDRR